MRDRVDAVGGTVTIVSLERVGTSVTAVIPRNNDAVPASGTMALSHRAG
jgi:signal transduction histidine kinase